MEKIDCFLWSTNPSALNELRGESENDRTGNRVSISADAKVIAISENLASVGGKDGKQNNGRVRVFKLKANGSGWSEIFRTLGDSDFRLLGHTIALSGDGNTLVVGDPFDSCENGKIMIYKDILSPTANDLRTYTISGKQGSKAGWHVDVSYDGNSIAYCNSFYNIDTFEEQGSIVVVKYNPASDEWEAVYHDDNEMTHSSQAVSISSDGNTVAVLERGFPINADDITVRSVSNDKLLSECRVRVLSTDGVGGGDGWKVKGQTIECIPMTNDSNHVVELSGEGNTVIIGERSFSLGEDYENIGRVRVFSFDGDWSLKGEEIFGDNIGDCSGNSVGISNDGNTIVIGEQKFSIIDDASNGGGANKLDVGRVRVMRFSSLTSNWVQNGNTIEGELEGDDSGTAVAISGNGEAVVVGEPLHGIMAPCGNKKCYGRVRVFDKGTNKFLDKDVDATAAEGLMVTVNGQGVDNVVAVEGEESDDEDRLEFYVDGSMSEFSLGAIALSNRNGVASSLRSGGKRTGSLCEKILSRRIEKQADSKTGKSKISIYGSNLVPTRKARVAKASSSSECPCPTTESTTTPVKYEVKHIRNGLFVNNQDLLSFLYVALFIIILVALIVMLVYLSMKDNYKFN